MGDSVPNINCVCVRVHGEDLLSGVCDLSLGLIHICILVDLTDEQGWETKSLLKHCWVAYLFQFVTCTAMCYFVISNVAAVFIHHQFLFFSSCTLASSVSVISVSLVISLLENNCLSALSSPFYFLTLTQEITYKSDFFYTNKRVHTCYFSLLFFTLHTLFCLTSHF